jgi:hypothetical protein
MIRLDLTSIGEMVRALNVIRSSNMDSKDLAYWKGMALLRLNRCAFGIL